MTFLLKILQLVLVAGFFLFIDFVEYFTIK